MALLFNGVRGGGGFVSGKGVRGGWQAALIRGGPYTWEVRSFLTDGNLPEVPEMGS